MKLNFAFRESLNFLTPMGVLILGLTGIVFLQLPQLRSQEATLTKAEYIKQEQAEKIQLDLWKTIPAFGFQNLLANWLYLRFIQYFGDREARSQTGYTLSPEYFQAVVERDPLFVDAHLKLAAATSIFAGQPQTTVKSLEKSLQFVSPKLLFAGYPPYYLWIYKGIDELLFLGDTQAAKKSYSMAANWASQYNDPVSQSIVRNTRETVDFLEKNPQSKIAQIGAWTLVLSSTTDQETQKRAFSEIQALGAKIIILPDGRATVQIPEHIN